MFFVRAAEEGKPGEKQPELAADAGQDTIARLDKLRHSQGSLSVAQIRSNLQKTMQADAAVFRTQVSLTNIFLMSGDACMQKHCWTLCCLGISFCRN